MIPIFLQIFYHRRWNKTTRVHEMHSDRTACAKDDTKYIYFFKVVIKAMKCNLLRFSGFVFSLISIRLLKLEMASKIRGAE